MNQETRPLISIIVAVFNGSAVIQQCIDSVARQTYQNKELIIIDGGSNDGTVELIKANHTRIRYWISEPDRGIYDAWNKGLAQAKGEWICFLGADDYLWDAQTLDQVADTLATLSSDIRVAYGKVMLVTNDGANLYAVGDPWEKVRNRFRHVMCIPHQAVMHRRSLFERHGKFDEAFRITGDYELLLRELKTRDAFFIPRIVTAMRHGGVSSNPDNALAVLRELRLAQRKNGQHRPGWIWLSVVASACTRLLLWRLLGEQKARKILDWGRKIMGLPPFWTRT